MVYIIFEVVLYHQYCKIQVVITLEMFILGDWINESASTMMIVTIEGKYESIYTDVYSY
jgi:hypothetical protein